MIRFINARLVMEDGIIEGDLWVSHGKIIGPQDSADETVDVKGKLLAPGFIDLQINVNPLCIQEVAKGLLQYGVIGFFPTVISSSSEQYRKVLPKLQPSAYDYQGAANFGIHLEGPYFASNYLGAHQKQKSIYEDLTGVKLVTLAPEVAGPLIEELKKHHIIISAGHSGATFSEMKAAIEQGVGFVTHLFNAMRPYHHREPGIIGAALLDPQMPYSLIVDGVHLSPETVLLCWKCNPEGLILVTDAVADRLGEVEIEKIGDQIYVKGTKTLAGSTLSMDRAVQNLKRITNCSTQEALQAASLKPAKLMGLYPAKGTLSVGADADFIILSDALEVDATYINGNCVWSNNH